MDASEKESCTAQPLPLNTRVNALLFDCGFAAHRNDENLVTRARQLASYFGTQLVSVLAVVEEAELAVYGSLRSGFGATARAPNSIASATGVNTVLDEPSAQSNEENVGKDGGTATLHFSISNVNLLVVIPWLVFFIWGFSYSSIALHYRLNGWPIWRLSMIALIGNIVRPVMNGILSSVGAWIAAPLATLALIMITPAVIWPDWELIVSIQLLVSYFFYLELAFQTVCFSNFSHSKDLLQRASRIQICAGTLGVAMSPFIGGLAYDIWGWRGCAAMHVGAQSMLTVGFWTGPGFRKDWERWKQDKSSKSENLSIEAQPLQRRKNCILVEMISSAFPIMSIPKSIRLPVLAAGFALGINSYSYQCEWSTYALYFREEHNWTSAMWAGICQMVGDVAGAIMLIVAQRFRKGSESEKGSSCPLFHKPYNLALLLGMWIVLNMGLTIKSLKFAVVSQILMGTVYVFFMQWTNEINMLYAFGDSEAYTKIRTVSLFLYTSFTATAAGTALLMYDNVGRLSPFYLSAFLCCAVLVFYLVVFFQRTGCGGNLEQIEKERCEAVWTGVTPKDTESAVIHVTPARTKESAPVA